MKQLYKNNVVLLLLLPAAVQARGKYIINADIMKQLHKDAVVLHPLPRVDEVRTLCVSIHCPDVDHSGFFVTFVWFSAFNFNFK
jgi:hypothetical protein